MLVAQDRNRRDKVLETYTFKVDYDNGSRTPSGLSLNGQKWTGASLQESNMALHQLLRDVNSLCEDIADLPSMLSTELKSLLVTDHCTEERYVWMRLTLKGASSDVRQLTGFVPNEVKTLQIPEADGWAMHTETFETVSGKHK